MVGLCYTEAFLMARPLSVSWLMGVHYEVVNLVWTVPMVKNYKRVNIYKEH